jgi:hypothetical protein
MSQHCRFDASRSLTALEQDGTISRSGWLRHSFPASNANPLRSSMPMRETLLKLLHRRRREAGQAGREIKRTPNARLSRASLIS